MKIICYKCVDTGQIFEDYRDYINHRRRYNREGRRLAKYQMLPSQKSEVISDLVGIDSISQLSSHIVKHWTYYWYNGIRQSNPFIRHYPDVIELGDIIISNVRYSDHISNREYSPIGHQTNWFRNPELPTGYSGWLFEISGIDLRYRYFDYTPIHRISIYQFFIFEIDFQSLSDRQSIVSNWQQLGSDRITL